MTLIWSNLGVRIDERQSEKENYPLPQLLLCKCYQTSEKKVDLLEQMSNLLKPVVPNSGLEREGRTPVLTVLSPHCSVECNYFSVEPANLILTYKTLPLPVEGRGRWTLQPTPLLMKKCCLSCWNWITLQGFCLFLLVRYQQGVTFDMQGKSQQAKGERRSASSCNCMFVM